MYSDNHPHNYHSSYHNTYQNNSSSNSYQLSYSNPMNALWIPRHMLATLANNFGPGLRQGLGGQGQGSANSNSSGSGLGVMGNIRIVSRSMLPCYPLSLSMSLSLSLLSFPFFFYHLRLLVTHFSPFPVHFSLFAIHCSGMPPLSSFPFNPACGLANLGNTCFMSSALQVIILLLLQPIKHLC